MDEEYGDSYLEISQLHVASAQVESQIELRKFEATPDETWYDQPVAHNLKLQHDSSMRWESIMKRHKTRIQSRIASGCGTFVRLFTTSKVGFNLHGGQGERDSSVQSYMRDDMLKVYCPDRPLEGYRRDSILYKWFDEENVHVTHLFPEACG
ncbi:hypothetical protein BHE90_017094 [Fusarium euwallaceae]|uniref:HNH nuclease domain-containing protein n=2 Tax=Fusarium solani species complex TaxID=232080 RepID=A0A3M2RJ65_9HYPO|nr:hypothetical protein CDV36_014066 [Fusarium kuroshium]RTE68529.1 hypothetical protein BHE90_017094 [Fusarium euwallaceae]